MRDPKRDHTPDHLDPKPTEGGARGGLGFTREGLQASEFSNKGRGQVKGLGLRAYVC